MSQYVPYEEIKFDKIVKLEDILNTPDDSDIDYFVGCNLSYPDIKDKTKNFPFCPESKVSPHDKFSDYMNEMKPNNYTQNKKIICDWTDRKNSVVHYRMVKFNVRQGMIVDNVHQIISFKQSKWLEKSI